jgi:hypothetical protein
MIALPMHRDPPEFIHDVEFEAVADDKPDIAGSSDDDRDAIH